MRGVAVIGAVLLFSAALSPAGIVTNFEPNRGYTPAADIGGVDGWYGR